MMRFGFSPDDLEDMLPGVDISEKRAAIEIISLRTKLEMRTLFLRFSLSLNTATLAALLLKHLL